MANVVWARRASSLWIGHHQSAAIRGLGAPEMALSMVVLHYVASRFGYELAGLPGAIARSAAFRAIEGALIYATSRAQIRS
jgi:hypothetical protein